MYFKFVWHEPAHTQHGGLITSTQRNFLVGADDGRYEVTTFWNRVDVPPLHSRGFKGVGTPIPNEPGDYPIEAIVLTLANKEDGWDKTRYYAFHTGRIGGTTLYVMSDQGKTLDKLVTCDAKGRLPIVSDDPVVWGSLLRAKNIIEWVCLPEFLGVKDLWKAQAVTLLDFFNEVCRHCLEVEWPPVWTTVHNNEVSTQSLLKRLSLTEHGQCPKCGGHTKPASDMVIVWGERSGKSLFGSMVVTYYIHRLLCYADLRQLYGLTKEQWLNIDIIATSPAYGWETVISDLRDTVFWKEGMRTFGGVTIDKTKVEFSGGLRLRFIDARRKDAVSAYLADSDPSAFIWIDELDDVLRLTGESTVEPLTASGTWEKLSKVNKVVYNTRLMPGIRLLTGTPQTKDSYLLQKSKVAEKFSHLRTWEVNPDAGLTEEEMKDERFNVFKTDR